MLTNIDAGRTSASRRSAPESRKLRRVAAAPARFDVTPARQQDDSDHRHSSRIERVERFLRLLGVAAHPDRVDGGLSRPRAAAPAPAWPGRRGAPARPNATALRQDQQHAQQAHVGGAEVPVPPRRDAHQQGGRKDAQQHRGPGCCRYSRARAATRRSQCARARAPTARTAGRAIPKAGVYRSATRRRLKDMPSVLAAITSKVTKNAADTIQQPRSSRGRRSGVRRSRPAAEVMAATHGTERSSTSTSAS